MRGTQEVFIFISLESCCQGKIEGVKLCLSRFQFLLDSDCVGTKRSTHISTVIHFDFVL